MTPISADKRYSFGILAILIAGAYLRFHNIDYPNLLHDSAASLEAAVAISKKNVPLLPSDIWYTRSPLYHYFLGFCLKLPIPLSPRLSGRCLTAFFSLICCYEVYILGKLMGNRKAGIAGAFLTSFNPFFIYMSRTIRFYSLATSFGLLTMICFYRGFIVDEENSACKIATFIFLPITFLMGEITSTVVPGTALGYLLFCRKPDFNTIKIIIFGTIFLTLAVFGDMILLYAKCRTPYIAMNISTSPQIVPHLKDTFANIELFLTGDFQSNILLTIFMCLGALWIVLEKNKHFFLLMMILTSSILMVQILVLPISQRYFFHLMPLYYLIAGFGAVKTLDFILSQIHGLFSGMLSPLGFFLYAVLVVFPILFALISDIQPMKLYNSYQINPVLNVRSEDAIKFVKQSISKEDVLLTPFGEVATIYDLKVDYYLLRKGYFDEVFYKNGQMIERHSGGLCVENKDKLLETIKRHPRVWVIYKDNKEFDEEMLRFIKVNIPVQATFGDIFVCLWETGAMPYKRTTLSTNHEKCYF